MSWKIKDWLHESTQEDYMSILTFCLAFHAGEHFQIDIILFNIINIIMLIYYDNIPIMWEDNLILVMNNFLLIITAYSIWSKQSRFYIVTF